MPSDDAHADPPAPPTTGLIASKYQLVRLIGRGGMGAVWEGRHASLGTRVAIKFIDTDYADSQEARTRFDNEARAAATIQSKHAIQIYDHGVTEDGKPYIVMELLQGEPLDQRIERVKRLSLQETARILRQVARALQRAHERGIVHRDLKPENIFLVRTPDEDDEIAKVLDFGIAKFKRLDGMGAHPGGLTSSTKTGAVLGTPFYMSPEQARGLREVDHRTDLWSMGVIAFKCVAGVLPFDGVSVGDLLVKICTSPPPVPSHVVPGLPTSFDAWFARALERDPARRFASAQELSDALAYAAGVSVRRGTPNLGEAPTVSASHPPAHPPARASSQPGHPSDASFSGSAPIAATVNAAVTSAPFTASAPRIGGSSSKGVVVAAALAAVVGAGIGVFAIVKLAGPAKSMGGGATVVSTLAATSPLASPPPAAHPGASAAPGAPTSDAHADAGAAHAGSSPGSVTPAAASSAPPSSLPADAPAHADTAPAHGRPGKGHVAKPTPAPSGPPATPAPGTSPPPGASPAPSAPAAASTPPPPPPHETPKPAPTTIDPGY